MTTRAASTAATGTPESCTAGGAAGRIVRVGLGVAEEFTATEGLVLGAPVATASADARGDATAEVAALAVGITEGDPSGVGDTGPLASTEVATEGSRETSGVGLTRSADGAADTTGAGDSDGGAVSAAMADMPPVAARATVPRTAAATMPAIFRERQGRRVEAPAPAVPLMCRSDPAGPAP
jgi:hypothetical protein